MAVNPPILTTIDGFNLLQFAVFCLLSGKLNSQCGVIRSINCRELEFSIDMGFTGYLENPIEVTSDFSKIANWMMDVVLDSYLYKGISLLCR